MKCTEMEHNGPIEILVNFQIYIFNNGWRSPFICKTLETYQQITKHYLQQLFSRGKKKKNQFSSERTNSIKNEFKNHVLCKHRELWFCNTGSRLLIAQPMQLFGAVSCLVQIPCFHLETGTSQFTENSWLSSGDKKKMRFILHPKIGQN